MYSTILCRKFVSGSIIHDLSRSLNTDVVSVLSKNTFSASCTKSFWHSTERTHTDKKSFLQPKSYTCTVSANRYYCKDYRPFPEVPEFPPVVWPNLLKSISGWLYSYLIVKPQYDKNFSLIDFANNSKQAIEVVSNCIAKRDFSSLQGLVTDTVLEQVKTIVSNLGDEEVKEMGFKSEDIYFLFPYQVEVVEDPKHEDRRFIEITMCYHAIHNLEEVKKRSEDIANIQKELKSSIFVLNYRFIREYTEGVNDAWTINAINHLKAEDHDKSIL